MDAMRYLESRLSELKTKPVAQTTDPNIRSWGPEPELDGMKLAKQITFKVYDADNRTFERVRFQTPKGQFYTPENVEAVERAVRHANARGTTGSSVQDHPYQPLFLHGST
jgi:hypothetical protein